MRVEGHLEHGRHAPGRRAACAGFPALPVGAAGFIEVYVRIHDAGQHHQVRGIDDRLGVAHFAPDCTDDSAGDGDIGWALSRGEDGGSAPDDEVGGSHTSSIMMSCAPSQSVSLPISGSCSWPCVRVAKWLPANCPTLLANIVEPYGNNTSVSLIPPG